MKTSRVTVIDYGIGNLHSVIKSLRACGAEVELSDSPSRLRVAERLVLPGVGAFADGMAGLRARDLIEPIYEFVRTSRPFLGICLGMQLLLSQSEEFGRHAGLGIIPGRVIGIPSAPGLKVPHVGWNRMRPPPGATWHGTYLDGLNDGAMVYFVHSFFAVPDAEGHRLADVAYGGHLMSAAVQKDNVVGCQFHPEKSGPDGLSVLRHFLAA